jgi:arabinofuranosyltransferase
MQTDETASLPGSRTITWAVILVPVVVVVAGGWAHRWVADDAFIDFRVVHNILAGHGPVFNVGERVEVYTDPLWVALLTVFYGVFRFIPLEWCSVVLGLLLTGVGVAFGGLTSMRLAARRGSPVVIPMGMLCVSVVAGTWDFATSGLETGLVFAWMGLSWWMVVRARGGETSVARAAFVAGLGVTIRPDLFLVSLAFAAALAALVVSQGRLDRNPVKRRLATAAIAFLAVPILSELFRIAYFGLLVSNTALTKSAFALWWSQGFKYLSNFALPYWLWFPMGLLLAVTVVRSHGWWRDGNRLDCIVLAAPAVGGLLDALYVVSIGGDFMHARLLLPGFFGLSLALWIDPRSVRERRLPLVATLAWASVCLGALRYTEPLVGPSNIGNERAIWIHLSGNPHPITLSDYARWARYGLQLLAYESAESEHPSTKINPHMIVNEQFGSPIESERARSQTPDALVAPLENTGVLGMAAGPNVYIFVQYSLANPISSHFTVPRRGQPGHEKFAALVWMVGRFGLHGEELPKAVYVADQQFELSLGDGKNTATEAQEIEAARAALNCEPLSGYLHAISSPISFGQAFANFEHTFTWTTMKFSSVPVKSDSELCNGGSDFAGARSR